MRDPETGELLAPQQQMWIAERQRAGEFCVIIRFRDVFEDVVKEKLEKFGKVAKRYKQPFGIVHRTTVTYQRKSRDTGFPYNVTDVVLGVLLPPRVGEKGSILGHYRRAEDGVSFYTHIFEEDRRAEVEAYKDRLGICEHCNTNRHRNELFVCQTEKGVKIVGSDCLKDFLGIDPLWATQMLEFVRFTDTGVNEESAEFRSRFDNFLYTESLVQDCFVVAKLHGGYSKDARGAIRYDLSLIQQGSGWDKESRRRWEEIEEKVKVTPRIDINAFVTYLDTMTGDFGSNLRLACTQEWVHKDRTYLILAGVGLFVGRGVEQEVKKAQIAPPKLVAANPGDRCAFYGTVLRAIPYTNEERGFSSLIVAIRCDDGENLLNFHTGEFTPEVGVRYALKFTVKRHGEDRRSGEPQTIVNRVDYMEGVVLDKTGVVKPAKVRKAA